MFSRQKGKWKFGVEVWTGESPVALRVEVGESHLGHRTVTQVLPEHGNLFPKRREVGDSTCCQKFHQFETHKVGWLNNIIGYFDESWGGREPKALFCPSPPVCPAPMTSVAGRCLHSLDATRG